jgi:Sulfotransferase family
VTPGCHDDSTSPVLIIGTERSGSNLLRLMLNAHQQFEVPHPPHFMRYLAPLAGAYGDLAIERNRTRLVRDALALQARHIHPWDYTIDPAAVVARAYPSVFGVVAAIYDQYREAAGKPRWGCKSTFMVDHVEDVLPVCPGARFIWLVRDPRDVAASAKEAVFGHCHPLLTARLWLAQQSRARAALDRHGPGRVHLLRYEDLVAGPEAALRDVCRFLAVDYQDAMIEAHQTAAARRTAELSQSWRKVGQPVSTAAVRSYSRRLSAAEVGWVEGVTRPVAAGLGYRMAERAARPSSPIAVRATDALLRLRIEARSLRTDRNYWQRKRRDAFTCRLAVTARARMLARRLSALVTTPTLKQYSVQARSNL